MNKTNFYNLEDEPNIGKEFYDFCIIGAGIVGIYLTIQLLQKNYKVLLIDSGPLKPKFGDEIGFYNEFPLFNYNGAISGRKFGVGGTSDIWGGLLIPHNKYDLEQKGFEQSWELIIRKVDDFKNKVLEDLSLNAEYFQIREDLNSFCKNYPSFSKSYEPKLGVRLNSNLRNFKSLLNKFKSDSNLKVLYNATATIWSIDEIKEKKNISSLTCISPKKNTIKIKSKNYIISSGALESCRILLELNQIHNNTLFNCKYPPGSILNDHISLPIAKVIDDKNNLFTKVLAPSFVNSSIVNYRFISRARNKGIPKGFFHFIFDNNTSAYNLIKDIQGSIQSRDLNKISIKNIPSAINEMPQITLKRFLFNKVYYPNSAKKYLNYDLSLSPSLSRNLSLSESKDDYGRKKLCIKWTLEENDLRNNQIEISSFIKTWNSSTPKLPKLEAIELAEINDYINEKSYDAYHPTGTTIIGDQKYFPILENLSISSFNNLYTISTGLLPTAGTANPTFTILCLAKSFCSNFKKKF